MPDAARPGLRHRVIHYRAGPTLSRERAAARISAYVYGNIIAFAALVPQTTSDVEHGHALGKVLGLTASTALAHMFAEIVAGGVKADDPVSLAETRQELRDSLPIVTSAVFVCVMLAAAWAGWLPARAALIISDVYLLVRMMLIPFVVERLRSTKPSARTVVTGIVAAGAAAGIALLKVLVSH